MDSQNTLTLRIKKQYLEAIRIGKKTIEYRNDSPFYARVFLNKNRWKFLYLHYQNPNDRIVVQIKGIRRIKKPVALANSQFVTTKRCWAIYLGSVVF